MPTLTHAEKEFLDVFLHEVSNEPFTGPATQAVHAIGVCVKDISWLATAYEREVPMVNYTWGHAAAIAPPLPWPDRETVLRRNRDLQQIWDPRFQPAAAKH